MNFESIEKIAGLTAGVMWPVAIIVIVLLFRPQIMDFIKNIKLLKIGDMTLELKRLSEKVDAVESVTRNLSVDIYNVTGDALKVREEIWNYVAGILKRVSPETRFEMALELNKYHFPRLGTKLSEVKAMLNTLGYFDAEPAGEYSEEITEAFVTSVFNFQEGLEMDYADGIMGPKTIAVMKRKIAGQKTV